MKKIIKIAFVAAFAAVAGYGVYTSQKTDSTMSELMTANVEALAIPEIWIAFCIDIPNIICSGVDMEDIEDIEGYRQY
ncbi:NVEALA domain-containing protein [uncultured Bacteroides sp.]|uniref:NVEALA domain-containing protein n=1 Tax=uncultured Bacteroides sp. TaxID=162156 RepID=UPI002674C332|nr:NVEALA domain-containing protein [uncultured Bacteroides sp.]